MRAYDESPGSLAWKVKQQQFRDERLEREAARELERERTRATRTTEREGTQ
jgi:hypothetical protein